jgi:hypothetical protein
MRSSPAIEQITAGLDALAATDVVALDDAAVREQLLALTTLANRVHAELVRRVDLFDRRGLAENDGFRTAKAWLQGVGRLPATMAHRLVRVARLLRRLPKLAASAQSGEVPAEHLQQVARLADRVSVERVAEVEASLADAARVLDLTRFTTVCERVRAHLDPDGPDPAADFDKRTLSLNPVQGMLLLRGQLDPEGGAALMTALDALMTPPGEGDERTAGQRRADAPVELARRQLTGGGLPSVGGHRPQVGVLLFPQALSPETLATLAEVHEQEAAGQRLREFLTEPAPAADWTRPGVAVDRDDLPTRAAGRAREAMLADLQQREAPPAAPAQAPAAAPAEPGTDPPRAGPAPPAWPSPGWADPPWLSWVGPISPVVAQRIACDADIWRIILDPTTGMPLDVGRAYRLVPHWIRRALYARDRGCRWPGCDVPAEWTDAHHLLPWAEHGETNVDDCVLLCRYHHGLVHEGGWSIDLDERTGAVHITRPEGIPYLIPSNRSSSWNGPSTQAA